MDKIAIQIENVSFSYAKRDALKNINLTVFGHEIFGLLGPNGGGKTTLFRILSTYFPCSSGSIKIFGRPIENQNTKIRSQIGVVFQVPSLDKKLTVFENLRHQAHLYGMTGEDLKVKINGLLKRFNLMDRSAEKVEFLSGGLQRRIEIVKSLIHSPSVLIMDEPSTGLDPGARRDLWDILKELRSQGTTILITTHLMEEAERCDRLAILSEGAIVALGTPMSLKDEIGGDVVVIESKNAVELSKKIQVKFQVSSQVIENTVRIEKEKGPELVPLFAKEFSGEISSIMVGKPTLEDVFIHRTGHRFWHEKEEKA